MHLQSWLPPVTQGPRPQAAESCTYQVMNGIDTHMVNPKIIIKAEIQWGRAGAKTLVKKATKHLKTQGHCVCCKP